MASKTVNNNSNRNKAGSVDAADIDRDSDRFVTDPDWDNFDIEQEIAGGFGTGLRPDYSLDSGYGG